MEIFKIIFLAIEQGITELLPISSSAHLILTGQLLNIEVDTYLLSVMHLGTSLALLIFFAPTLFKDFLKKNSLLFYIKIAVSIIPVAVIGLLFQDTVENILRKNIVIVISLIVWGVAMIMIEREYNDKEEIDLHSITWKQSLVMGISQILALIPGTSRSGITTLSGILTGVNKYSALQYSFILGIPTLLGATTYEILKEGNLKEFSYEYLIGILISAIFGYLSLLLLKKIKKTNWLTIFGYYRIALGIVILLVIL